MKLSLIFVMRLMVLMTITVSAMDDWSSDDEHDVPYKISPKLQNKKPLKKSFAKPDELADFTLAKKPSDKSAIMFALKNSFKAQEAKNDLEDFVNGTDEDSQ